jgi:hypothetical protein
MISMTIRLGISSILLSITAYVWSQDTNQEESNNRRNLAAKSVYLISLGHLLFELFYKSNKQTIMELFTKIALIIIKPIIIVNG